MIARLLEQAKNFICFNMAEDDKQEFFASINKISVARARITTRMFIVLGFILLAASFGVKRGDLFRKPDIYYGAMYVILILIMLVFMLLFDRLELNIVKNGRSILAAGSAFAVAILAWCAGISLLDQIADQQIIIYVLAVISIAVAPLFRPITLLMIYLPVHALFLILLLFFQDSKALLFGNYINSTTVLIIAWIISGMRFRSRVEDYDNKKKVQEKSKELKRLNKELEEANRKLEILSKTDSLTGIYNRSVFNDLLETEWVRCMKKKKPLSLIMIDIDFFKAFNDNYGHQAGDVCLKKVAGVLSDCAKKFTDAVIRYGGEEFTIVLSHIAKESALELAEELRRKVEDLRIPHEFSPISKYLTISLGVYAVIPTSQLSIDDFIRTADKALYVAKSEERNKVVAS